MATEGLVRNRMELPLKENRTDQSGRIGQGAHVSSSRIPHCRSTEVEHMCCQGGIIFCCWKIKKMWFITLLYVITERHMLAAGRFHALLPVLGIMRDAIWERNYLLSIQRLHQVQLSPLPSKGAKHSHIRKCSQHIWNSYSSGSSIFFSSWYPTDEAIFSYGNRRLVSYEPEAVHLILSSRSWARIEKSV